MRRRRMYRILALPLALWFVALVAAAGDLDACPMHHAMGSGAAGAMPGMAMPGMPATAPTPGVPANPDQHRMPPCTCPGVCCCCAAVTLPAPASTVVATVAQVCVAPAVVWRAEPHGAPAAHVLPPAIGPPALHTA